MVAKKNIMQKVLKLNRSVTLLAYRLLLKVNSKITNILNSVKHTYSKHYKMQYKYQKIGMSFRDFVVVVVVSFSLFQIQIIQCLRSSYC